MSKSNSVFRDKRLKVFLSREKYALGSHWANAPRQASWWPGDTKERFLNTSKEHQDYWNSLPPISYDFNKYRFRCGELSEQTETESIMFLGCSMTFGIGVHKEKTWPYLVAKELGLKEINLGIPGGNLDSAYRVYSYWQSRIKSKYTCLLFPPGKRFECDQTSTQFVTETHPEGSHRFVQLGHWTLNQMSKRLPPFKEEHWPEVAVWLEESYFSDQMTAINTRKNIDAISNIAKETNSTLFYTSTECSGVKHDTKARDNVHPGPQWHEQMAEKFINEIKIPPLHGQQTRPFPI